MLRSLTVDNYALIEHLEMGFGPHLNIVTGETGAGKSILLGALGLLLGTRGEAGVQGDQTRNCVVEGVFSVYGYGLEDFFADNDLDFSPETIVRRVISVNGKSRAYVNELPVNLSVLRELGDRLIDIHSQHENLLLKDDRFRISIVDVAAGQTELVTEYAAVFNEWRALERQLQKARNEADSASRDEDYLRHQVEELAALTLKAGEQEELESEQRQLEHADEIREVIGLCVSELAADESSVLSRLKSLRQATERIRHIHPQAEEFASRLGSSYIELQDLEREISADYEKIGGDPERLEIVNQRLDSIWSLERKHRVESVEELIALQTEFEARLDAIDNSDEKIQALESETASRHNMVATLAEQISEGRKRASKEVSTHVENTLKRLGMGDTKFIVEISKAANRKADGGDDVRFLFTANPTVAPRPVEKIASGGETSRVMLALKTLSVKALGQPTVIFDEIDAGVSGRVADAMGGVISELSQESQVINITHLPQIASGRGEHFLVYKQNGATQIRQLSREERVTEIAKMLSGNVVTEAALNQAIELLG